MTWLILLLCVTVSTQEQSCSTVKPKNSTATVGKQLANLTFDLPLNVPNILSETCCSIAQSFASHRSKNSTDPVGWTATVLGPSTTHKGQSSVNCAAYDYGSSQKPAPSHTSAGMTPPLAPFPPPPPPCATYNAWEACPASRCFWTHGACKTTPPINCTYTCKGPGHCPAGPMCVHLALNTSQFSAMKLIGNAGSFNETILAKPTVTFKDDTFFSVSDGLANTLKEIRPFRFCSQFQATDDKNRTAFAEVAVCVSLLGGAQFDLQVATTHGLAYKANWITGTNLVANVVIHDNTTTTTTAGETQSTTVQTAFAM